MIKAIVFDIDNTLVNFMRMKRHAVDTAVEAMMDHGLPGKKEELIENIFKVYWREGIEDQQIFNKILMEFMGRMDYRILAAGIIGYRRAKEAYMAVYPHVHPTLTEFARMGVRMGVVSDAPMLQVWMRIVGLELAHYFEAVVTFDDSGEKKPSPKPFNMVLNRLGVDAGDAIMIGDWAERDIVGGKNAGMKTVFARYGDEFKTGVSGADYDIMDIRELVDIVRKLNSESAAA